MNCPFHILIYRSRGRSYRELPLRLFEFGTVYRYEKSGVVHGLTRVRGLTMDDAHIFCTKEQMGQELRDLLRFVLDLLRDYGLTDFFLELSTRDESEKFAWCRRRLEEATAALRAAAESSGLDLVPDPGGAAFYGPKISVQARDAIGRTWQMSTIQVDFQFPQRFDLEYLAADGSRQRPVMIHRALFGSIERFGVLTEHYAGAFPPWLAPVQVVAIPISTRTFHTFEAVADWLRAQGYGSKSTPATTGCRRRSVPHRAEGALHAARRGQRRRRRRRVLSLPQRRAEERRARGRGHRGDRRRDPHAGTGVTHDGVGDPDAFQRLWQPHRMAYIKGEGKPANHDAGYTCPFCRIPTLPDDEGLIVARGTLVYAVLNLYPYNAGHLMVVPYRGHRRLHRTHRRRSGRVCGADPAGTANAAVSIGRAGLQHGVQPRGGGRCRHRSAPGPTHRAALGRRHEHDADHGHTRVLPQLLKDTRTLLAEAWTT